MARAGAALVEDARSTRDAILDTAERRFAGRGFAGVSMREIAAEAGLRNQASLYHHFRNKRALYEAVLARGVERLVGFVAETGSGGASREAVLDRVIDYLLEHPNLPRLIQRAGLDDRRHLSKAVTRLLYPLYAQGVEVITAASPSWPAGDVPHLAAALYHMIFGWFASASLFEAILEQDPLATAAVQRQRRFLKTAVRRLLDAETSRPGEMPRRIR